jgi:hypothetical protein
MNKPLCQLNRDIKAEADELLYAQGLFKILCSYGAPHISGSYSLDLMVWRDLDIYLQVDDLRDVDFFDLGRKINTLLSPVKMSFRNELIGQSKDLPSGLYWGIYLGNERAGAWKIDLWAVEPKECKTLLEYCSDLQRKLTRSKKDEIMAIKSGCWNDPEYRRSYNSTDIYHSVIEGSVTDLETFRNFLKAGKCSQDS